VITLLKGLSKYNSLVSRETFQFYQPMHLGEVVAN